MDLRLRVSSETSMVNILTRRTLFQKILSSTDVGENGKYVLLIPRRFAKRYFPDLSYSKSKAPTKTFLYFEDLAGKRYQFRYRFEKLNNSFVFGAGWRDFVKDKELQEGDLVSFDQGCDGKLYIRCDKDKGAHQSSQVRRSSTMMTSITSSTAMKLERPDVQILPTHSESLARTGVGYSSKSTASSGSSRTREKLHQAHSTDVLETVKLFGVAIRCSKTLL